MPIIEKVKLFVNDNEKSKIAAEKVEKALKNHDMDITNGDEFNLAIAIGGDGSFLRMVNKANFKSNCLYVGINAGTLGFAQDISIDEIDEFIGHLNSGYYNYEEIGIATIKIEKESGEEIFHCLNEIVVRNNDLSTIHMNTSIDEVLLENFTGDGLLISTSFGSTAYNLCYGGSIVYNEFSTLQITPIAPMNNKSYRTISNSLIIPSTKKITLEPSSANKDFLLTIDGNNKTYKNVEKIEISIKSTIMIVRKKEYNYIRKINDKFIK